MSIAWIIFLGEQLLAIFIFSLVALITVWNRQKSFQRESAWRQMERYPLETFQRFLLARVGIIRSYRLTNTIVLLVIAVVIGLSVGFETTSSSIFFEENTIVFLLNPIIALVIGLLVGSYVNDIVGAIVVDVEAMQFFQIGTLQRSDVQKQKLRTLLISYLPALLIIEAYDILAFVNIGNLLISITVIVCVAILWVLLRTIFALQYHILLKPTYLLGQSEWASLEPRIRAWANLMGVELAGIYVQKDLIGQVNAYALGLGKPNLLVSETFLRYSEWRQQDALICMTLGLARRKVVQANLLLNLVISFITLSFVIFAFGILLPLTSFVNTIDILPSLLLLILAYFLIRIGSIYARSFIKKRYFDADRLSAFVTGDPVALMVALNTVNVFNSVLVTQNTLNVPSAAARMSNLDMLIRQSWPRAPQAGMPIPSVVAVAFGQYYLTVPFNQATEAGPVPTTPFVPLQ